VSEGSTYLTVTERMHETYQGHIDDFPAGAAGNRASTTSDITR
jgi:hypothetical protein